MVRFVFSEQFHLPIQENTSIDESFIPIIAFAVTFLIIILTVRVLGLILDKIIKIVTLGLINRVLGGVFGVLNGTHNKRFVTYSQQHRSAARDHSKRAKEKGSLYQPISEIVPLY